MIYARAHDRTVAGDYYAAMAQIEKRLDLRLSAADDALTAPISSAGRIPLLALLTQLAEPQLEPALRLKLVEQMRELLLVEPVPAGPPETDSENLLLEVIRRETALVSLAEVW
jgi:hypothetical protein